MNVATLYPDSAFEFEKSTLPIGGRPVWDRAYQDDIRDFLEEIAPRVLDILTARDGEIAPGFEKVVNHFSLTGHLYKRVVGWEFPAGTGPNFQHKVRFLAVQWHHRKAELLEELRDYTLAKARELAERHEAGEATGR